MCLCPASNFRKVMWFICKWKKSDWLAQQQNHSFGSVSSFLLCKDSSELWDLIGERDEAHSSCPCVTFSPEELNSYSPSSFLGSPRHWNAKLVPFCFLAPSHLATSSWAQLPTSGACLLSWLDTVPFLQQLSWCACVQQLSSLLLVGSRFLSCLLPSFPHKLLGLMW